MLGNWNNCEDYLPPDETLVLVYLHNGKMDVGAIFLEYPTWEEGGGPPIKYWMDENENETWEWFDVTHWMPLPEPPL